MYSRIAKLKHDIYVAGDLYQKDTIVEVLDADDPLIQEAFPGIKQNLSSKLIAVKFPGRSHVTVGLTKSFELC